MEPRVMPSQWEPPELKFFLEFGAPCIENGGTPCKHFRDHITTGQSLELKTKGEVDQHLDLFECETTGLVL